MKYLFFFLSCFCYFHSSAQLQTLTGYAVNKRLADGPVLQVGYDIKICGRLYTKPQAGFKYLNHYNDFVGARYTAKIAEIHETFSYAVVNRSKYILKPNLGINYRWYFWKGKMDPPYDQYPQRVYQIEFRDERMVLNSFAGGEKGNYHGSNLGFSIQLENQFKLNGKLWLLVTPFLEPDYDGTQSTGGCYVGFSFKK